MLKDSKSSLIFPEIFGGRSESKEEGELSMKIYVGNLSYDVNEEELRSAFEAHGEVTNVTIVTDRYTSRPRGFGFVEMNDDEQGRAAIAALNETELKGRQMRIDEARPRGDSGGNRW
jgi:RNA recognition motif-containing protein